MDGLEKIQLFLSLLRLEDPRLEMVALTEVGGDMAHLFNYHDPDCDVTKSYCELYSTFDCYDQWIGKAEVCAECWRFAQLLSRVNNLWTSFEK